jgi:hypothetical protein
LLDMTLAPLDNMSPICDTPYIAATTLRWL